MNINISDTISGEERRKALELYPIIYALKKFNSSIGHASEFLGMSKHSLYTYMQSQDVLRPLIQIREKRRYEEEISKIESIDWQGTEERDPVYKIFRYHLNRSMKSFMWNQMNDSQRKELVKKIRSLYYGIS